jgi:hypothetical protein
MTDQTLNCFLAKGTNADRLAFTPAPPTPASGPNPTYIWFETDTGDTYAYDGTDWQQVNNGGASADSAVWGAITGTLSDQADLQTALDAKTDEAYADAGDASTLADAEAYTDAAIASISGGGAGAPLNGIVSGCGVAYTGSLGFSMSAGSAYIDGTLVTASAQTLTLDAADATNPRIDVLYLNDSGTFGKITGTAAASPSQPATDPTTQLYLTFVLVPAAATDLNTGITTETIYDEGTEWTATTSGTGFTVDSTNNPNSGTKCIEGTSVAAGSYVKFVDGSPTSFDGDGNLLLSIRSKASWNAKRSLTLQWYASGVAKGSPVTLKSGSFGFDSANTTTYQLLVISKALFAVPAGTTNDELRITAAGSGGSAIGFYIDPIKLQTTGTTTGGGTTISGITQEQADARYLKLTGGTLSGDLTVPAETYGAGWNGSNEVPTKNDVYDKIEAVVAGVPGTYTDEMAQDAVATMIAAGTNTGMAITYNDAGNAESIAVDAATAAQIQAGTANKVVMADKLQASAAPQTLTDGATVSWDMSLGYNAKVTLGGNRTLTVSNPVLGIDYSLAVIQDGTGSRTVTWPSSFDWGTAGAPTLTTTASKVDQIVVRCTDASTPKFRAYLAGKGFSS